MNGSYVNEENHQKVKKTLKKSGIVLLVLGIVLAIVGVVLLVVGFTSFGKGSVDDPQNMFSQSTSSMALFVLGGLALAGGFAMLGFGIYTTFFAHAREVASYTASSIAPVVGDTVNYMSDNVAPSVNNAIGGLAEAITGGISKGKNAGKATKKCDKCGTMNSEQSKFCSNCGYEFVTDKYCKSCGEKLDTDSKFCKKCGTKVE